MPDFLIGLARHHVFIDARDMAATDDRFAKFFEEFRASNCDLFAARKQEFHSFELATESLMEHGFAINWTVDGILSGPRAAEMAYDVHNAFLDSGDLPDKWSFRVVRTVHRRPFPEIATDFVYGLVFGFSTDMDAFRGKMYL